MLEQQEKFKAGAELRRRVILAASRLFAEEGYENVSVRHIAQLAGCSQMAMYRHFPDKASLLTHVCIALYREQTLRDRRKVVQITSPLQRLIEIGRQSIETALKNPHHYRLAFLTPLPDADAQRIRAEVARPAMALIRQNLRDALPRAMSEAELDTRLRQLLACLHGTIVQLITYPHNYKASRRTALADFEQMLRRLVAE